MVALLLLRDPPLCFLGQHIQRHGTQRQDKVVEGADVEIVTQVSFRLVSQLPNGVFPELVA